MYRAHKRNAEDFSLTRTRIMKGATSIWQRRSRSDLGEQPLRIGHQAAVAEDMSYMSALGLA